MKKTINTITFAQASDNTKAVVANKYVAHALYTQNKALVESLGGTVLKGVGGFRAEFKSVKNAKDFIAKAITHIDAEDYAKTRKTEPKAKAESTPKKVAPTTAKGKKAEAPKKSKDNVKPTTAPKTTNAKVDKSAKAPTKSKGNANLTDAQKKALDRMKMSILNRAASAYSIANGGSATNFKDLGKSEKDLEAYMPKAKADLLKSDKWAKASATHNLTADML